MTRKGRSPAAGNGGGNDEVELDEVNQNDNPSNSDMEGTPSLAEINAFRQAQMDKAAAQEKPGKHPARLG